MPVGQEITNFYGVLKKTAWVALVFPLAGRHGGDFQFRHIFQSSAFNLIRLTDKQPTLLTFYPLPHILFICIPKIPNPKLLTISKHFTVLINGKKTALTEWKT